MSTNLSVIQAAMPPATLFEKATNIVIHGGSFVGAQSNTKQLVSDAFEKNLAPLQNKVSWNAILNAGGRADPVKCYPGTRTKVILQITIWMDDRGLRQRILWLCGPAGAGKSAIAQSVAELCLERRIPMVNFFFFRSDPTRNHASPLVATLLYQIFDICPAIKWQMNNFLAEHPMIFNTPITHQIKTLLLAVIDHIHRLLPEGYTIVLIIDGLDECSSDEPSVQQDILGAFHAIATHPRSPFILLLSSRAEPHLRMSITEIQASVRSIFLDGESFEDSEDIRRYTLARFVDIKRTHHLSSHIDEDWPGGEAVDAIISKSSGQFIYAATVMRFISMSPEHPALTLEIIQGIRPSEDTSPFAQLDAVYTYILLKTKSPQNWWRTRDILGAYILPSVMSEQREPVHVGQDHALVGAGAERLRESEPFGVYSFVGTGRSESMHILHALGYTMTEITSYTSHLTALLTVKAGEIKFYHSSLGDFLVDPKRSKEYHIDLDRFRLRIIPPLLKSYSAKYMLMNNFWPIISGHFLLLASTDDKLNQALIREPQTIRCSEFQPAGVKMFLSKIFELYSEADNALYTTILERWRECFRRNGVAEADLVTAVLMIEGPASPSSESTGCSDMAESETTTLVGHPEESRMDATFDSKETGAALKHLGPLDDVLKSPVGFPLEAKADLLGAVGMAKQGDTTVPEGKDSATLLAHSEEAIRDIIIHGLDAILSKACRDVELLEEKDTPTSHLVSDAEVAIEELLDALTATRLRSHIPPPIVAQDGESSPESFNTPYINIVMPVPINVTEHKGMVESVMSAIDAGDLETSDEIGMQLADRSPVTSPHIALPQDVTDPASHALEIDPEHDSVQETIYAQDLYRESREFFKEALTDSLLHDFTSLRGEAEVIANEIIAARVAASAARQTLQDAYAQAESIRAQSEMEVTAAQYALGVIEQERARAASQRDSAIRALREAEDDTDYERSVASVEKGQAGIARLEVQDANRELNRLQSEIAAARALLANLRREVAESLRLNTMEHKDEESRKDGKDGNSEEHDVILCPRPTLFTYLKEDDIVASNYTWMFL